MARMDRLLAFQRANAVQESTCPVGKLAHADLSFPVVAASKRSLPWGNSVYLAPDLIISSNHVFAIPKQWKHHMHAKADLQRIPPQPLRAHPKYLGSRSLLVLAAADP